MVGDVASLAVSAVGAATLWHQLLKLPAAATSATMQQRQHASWTSQRLRIRRPGHTLRNVDFRVIEASHRLAIDLVAG